MKNTLTVSRGFKALLLAGGAGTIALASPAFAQDNKVDCGAHPDDPSCVSGKDTIVVTGSRIQRKDFEANSPTVTVDQNFLKQSSTGAIEQQLNKLPQFVVSQTSTVKNNDPTGLLPAGGDIQPNATNTPGAATISLRGVGANRSLVLIDGRRGVPGNASGAVDISTIPSSALERVEIVSGGQSATYGADAVAGVTNFILRKNFQGLEMDAQMGINQWGSGFEYTLSGIMGTDFPDGRGNISIAMSTNHRDLFLQADHPWYKDDLWQNPDTTAGTVFFTPRPGISGLSLPANGVCEGLPGGCVLSNMFPGANPTVPNNTASVYLNQDGSLIVAPAGFFSNGYATRGATPFFKPWPGLDDNYRWKTLSNGAMAAINGFTPVTVPTTRYNFLARGNYEINDWIGVFAQGMFSHSTTYTVQEPGPLTFGWDVILPWGNGVYTGQVPGFLNGLLGDTPYQNPAVPPSVLVNGTPMSIGGGLFVPYSDPTPNNLADNPTNPAFQAMFPFLNCAGYTSHVGGCTNTEAFKQVIPANIQALLNAQGATSFSLAGYLPQLRATYSDVKTYNLVAGFQGSIPGTDWTWEAYVNHGISQTLSTQTGMYSLERTRALFTAPNMGQGFSYTGNQFGGLGGLSSGFGATTGTCTTGLNFFSGYAGVSQDCLDAINADISNKSTARQTIAEANFQGKLFDLPAGELRAAIGASYREERYEFINETLSTAGESFLDQTIGIYPSQNMPNQGYNVKEVYGELLVPVLHDVPGIKQFNLELGGRMSDYTTTGTSYTFKILGDWEVTDWLRLRGGFNRAERAPNIAELQLTPQQSFATDPIGDVCSTQNSSTASANPNANTTDAYDVQAMCLALMARDNGGIYVPSTDAASYYHTGDEAARQPQGTGGGSAFPVAVGNQYYRDHINPNIAPLKPEVANTWTAGLVIQSPVSSGPLSRLQLSLDYFNITINDPIGNSGGGGVLLHCVSPEFNPAAAGVAGGATSTAALDNAAVEAAANAAIQQGSCPDVFRTPTNASANQFGAFDGARVITTFDNDGKIELSGLDMNLSWSSPVGPGTLFLNLNGNYMFHFKVQPFTGTPLLDYVGTTGTGLKGVNYGSSFRWKLFSTLGYTWHGLNASIQWQHTPATDDACNVAYKNGLASTPCAFTGIPAYDLFNFNSSYQLTDNLTVRFGIDNLFNKEPAITGVNTAADPSLGQLPGGSFTFFDDVQGRRFSLGANIKF